MKRTMLKALCLLLAVICIQAQAANDSAPSDNSVSRIENGLREAIHITGNDIQRHSIVSRLDHHNIPGLSIAVAYKGEVLWAKGYGMADIAASTPMRTDTMLLAGSISKPVAALRALQLHEDGKLLLDKNINSYLSSWHVPDNEFTENQKVTLRRILNHTAGLTVWGFPGYDKGDDIPSTVEVLDGKGNTDPVRVFKTPGESWQYSGGGYTIMQLAIADIDNKPFAQSLKSHVLTPLNMTDSTFENPLPENYHPRAATGYRSTGDEVEGKWPIYPEMAAAGLWTTPSELVQYGIEIQRIMDTRQDGIIDFDTAKEMLTPGENDHGLGPVVVDDMFSHGGADEGFRARFVAWRNQPYVAVVMVNSDNGTIIPEVLRAITAEYDLPGFEVEEKTVVDLPEAALDKFIGDYNTEEDGIFRISRSDEGLTFTAINYDYTSELLPQSDHVFFERRSGAEMTFTVEKDKATKLSWQRFTAHRVAK